MDTSLSKGRDQERAWTLSLDSESSRSMEGRAAFGANGGSGVSGQLDVVSVWLPEEKEKTTRYKNNWLLL